MINKGDYMIIKAPSLWINEPTFTSLDYRVTLTFTLTFIDIYIDIHIDIHIEPADRSEPADRTV